MLAQPEVGKVTEAGNDYYPDDVEPPSLEQVGVLSLSQSHALASSYLPRLVFRIMFIFKRKQKKQRLKKFFGAAQKETEHGAHTQFANRNSPPSFS